MTTNQFTLGYKAGLDAAVKVCEDKHDYMCSRAAEAIAALPVPSSSSEDCGEIQWRDLTDDDIADVFWNGFSKQREEDYTWNDVARAVIAKFKEKQHV